MGRHSSEVETAEGLEYDWWADRVGAARRDEHPLLLARMRTGWAVMGDTQFLPGYCLLMADLDGGAGLPGGGAGLPGGGAGLPGGDGRVGPATIDHLTDLPRPARAEFLSDMGLLGEAVMLACNGLDPFFRRLNYEILGNRARGLHAHIFPRYGWEPDELLTGTVWAYPADRWTSPRDAYSDEHEPLREAITAELTRIMADAYDAPHLTALPAR